MVLNSIPGPEMVQMAGNESPGVMTGLESRNLPIAGNLTNNSMVSAAFRFCWDLWYESDTALVILSEIDGVLKAWFDGSW